MPIVYDAVNNIITVTGFTVGVPCTFQDICDANDLGGWGVVDALGDTQFYFYARIRIGNDADWTYFADVNVQVTFDDSCLPPSDFDLIRLYDKTSFYLGQLDDAASKTTSHGCSIISEDLAIQRFISAPATSQDIYAGLYGCSFTAVTPNINAYHKIVFANPDRTVHIYNCSIENGHISASDNLDIYNLYTTRGVWGIRTPLTNSTMEHGIIRDKNYAFYADYANTLYIEDFDVKNIVRHVFRGVGISVDSVFVNITWEAGGVGTAWMSGTHAFVIRYTVDLLITDKDNNTLNGVGVVLRDRNGVIIFSVNTGGDGKIATQTVTGREYTAGFDVFTNMTPHTLTLTRSGYDTINMELTLDHKIDWQILLEAPKHTSSRAFKVIGRQELKKT